MRLISRVAAVLLLSTAGAALAAPAWWQVGHGIAVTPADGGAMVRVISPGQGGDPLANAAPGDRTVDYSGQPLQIRLGD